MKTAHPYRPAPEQESLRCTFWTSTAWQTTVCHAKHAVAGLALIAAAVIAAIPVPAYLGDFLLTAFGVSYVQRSAADVPAHFVHWSVGVAAMFALWAAPRLGRWWLTERRRPSAD